MTSMTATDKRPDRTMNRWYQWDRYLVAMRSTPDESRKDDGPGAWRGLLLNSPVSVAFARYALALLLALIAIQSAQAQVSNQAEQRYPDVLSAQVRVAGAGIFDFDVTISSPYDTPQRYADAFRVLTPAGKVLGQRILWHDHQNEQPFTRDLYSLTIPTDVATVVIQARDKKYGYGGKSITVKLPGR